MYSHETAIKQLLELDKKCAYCNAPLHDIVQIHHHTECLKDHDHNKDNKACNYQDVTK